MLMQRDRQEWWDTVRTCTHSIMGCRSAAHSNVGEGWWTKLSPQIELGSSPKSPNGWNTVCLDQKHVWFSMLKCFSLAFAVEVSSSESYSALNHLWYACMETHCQTNIMMNVYDVSLFVRHVFAWRCVSKCFCCTSWNWVVVGCHCHR